MDLLLFRLVEALTSRNRNLWTDKMTRLDERRVSIQLLMMKHLLAAIFLALFCRPSFAESVYTELDLDACKALEQDDQGGRWVCKGWGGYPVEFAEGDIRQSLFIGYLGPWATKNHWESLGPFNHIGGTIEWITAGKIAKAAISRFIIENSNPETGEPDKAFQGQVLVIFKVGQKGEGEACTVGYVDARANPLPNELARKVAAKDVAGFKCRVDTPQWHGLKGSTAGDGTSSFGD